jgi:hypothetical protein
MPVKGTGSDALFEGPSGIALDKNGVIYVSDAGTPAAAGTTPPVRPPADTTVVRDTAVITPPPPKTDSVT